MNIKLWKRDLILIIFILLSYILLTGIFHKSVPSTYKKIGYHEISILYYFINVVFFAPLLEEVCFRLVLKYKPQYLKISLLGILFYVLFFHEFSNLFTTHGNFFLLRIFLFIGLGVAVLLIKLTKYQEKLSKFWNRRRTYIWVISILLFTVMHYPTYNFDVLAIWHVALLSTLTMLFAFLLSIIRVKFGFALAVLCHSLNNAISIIALLFILGVPISEVFKGVTFNEFQMEKIEQQERAIRIIKEENKRLKEKNDNK